MSKTNTENTIPEMQAPETAGGLPLDVRVRPIAPMGNLLAFANVTIGGCFKIDGFRICSGEKGLRTMRSMVEMFHRNGGSVIQFTVFSAEELRDAQAHPEKYENLQVRVCGWNVRWNDLSRAEQDAYIRRAENIMR